MFSDRDAAASFRRSEIGKSFARGKKTATISLPATFPGTEFRLIGESLYDHDRPPVACRSLIDAPLSLSAFAAGYEPEEKFCRGDDVLAAAAA